MTKQECILWFHYLQKYPVRIRRQVCIGPYKEKSSALRAPTAILGYEPTTSYAGPPPLKRADREEADSSNENCLL